MVLGINKKALGFKVTLTIGFILIILLANYFNDYLKCDLAVCDKQDGWYLTNIGDTYHPYVGLTVLSAIGFIITTWYSTITFLVSKKDDRYNGVVVLLGLVILTMSTVILDYRVDLRTTIREVRIPIKPFTTGFLVSTETPPRNMDAMCKNEVTAKGGIVSLKTGTIGFTRQGERVTTSSTSLYLVDNTPIVYLRKHPISVTMFDGTVHSVRVSATVSVTPDNSCSYLYKHGIVAERDNLTLPVYHTPSLESVMANYSDGSLTVIVQSVYSVYGRWGIPGFQQTITNAVAEKYRGYLATQGISLLSLTVFD